MIDTHVFVLFNRVFWPDPPTSDQQSVQVGAG